MKILFLSAFLPLIVGEMTDSFSPLKKTDSSFSPLKISYKDLLHNQENEFQQALADALSTTGLVSITGLPHRDDKLAALAALPDCLNDSPATLQLEFPDGTVRQTLATHSLPHDRSSHIDFKTSTSQACLQLDSAAMDFRATVATATQALANRLTQLYPMDDPKVPLLISTSQVEDTKFGTIAQVVEQGEFLEHFHSYSKTEEHEQEKTTIEMHVDQGMLLAFTPGLWVHKNNMEMTPSSGFYIETQNGGAQEVRLDETDDLVFLLGDGVSQYINDRLSPSKKLRPCPHALEMTAASSSDDQRVWYGLMVLPPPDAVHPIHGETFAKLRQELTLEESETALHMGCSSSLMARALHDITCDADTQFYCWHRCFNTTAAVCTEANTGLKCANAAGDLWDETTHSSEFSPRCLAVASDCNNIFCANAAFFGWLFSTIFFFL